jgi:hypothetical protein
MYVKEVGESKRKGKTERAVRFKYSGALRVVVLWCVKTCNVVEMYRHFGGTRCAHRQYR